MPKDQSETDSNLPNRPIKTKKIYISRTWKMSRAIPSAHSESRTRIFQTAIARVYIAGVTLILDWINATRLWYERLFINRLAQASWKLVNPVNQAGSPWGMEADLNDVATVDPSLIVAVGNAGAIIRSTDFGVSWSNIDSGTRKDLLGIDMRGQDGVVVGNAGIILRTTDGGLTWGNVTPSNLWSLRDTGVAPVGPNGTNYLVVLPDDSYCLNSVAFGQDGEVIAVGDVNSRRGFMLRSVDGGLTWADISDWETPALKEVEWSPSAFVGGANVDARFIVVGGDFYGGVAPHFGARSQINFSVDGGSEWLKLQYVDGPTLDAVGMVDARDAYAAASEDNFFRTTDGGMTWEARPSPLPWVCWYTPIYDIDFATQDIGMLTAKYGFMATTADGGISWNTIAPSKTRIDLPAVSMLDETQAIVVGHGSTALVTNDGGASWSGPATITFEDLYGISFVDSLHGLVVGDRGDVFRTYDGGYTWEALDIREPRGIQFSFRSVVMLDAASVIIAGPAGASGGWVWKSADFGASWEKMHLPVNYGVLTLSAYDAQHWVALTERTLEITGDGGQSWSTRPLPQDVPIRSVQMIAPSDVIIVGHNGLIMKSTQNGMQSQDSGVNSRLLGVSFIDEFTGWVVGATLQPGFEDGGENLTIEGVILATNDGGATWNAQASGTNLPLRNVFFIDSQVGIAVGGLGWANYTGLEQPVILRTDNGGASWTSDTVGTDIKNLNSAVMLDQSNGIAIGREGTIVRTTV